MISISEILKKLQLKSVENLDLITIFSDNIFNVTGVKIEPKKIRLTNNKIILDRSIPSVIKNQIALKKNLILCGIKNKIPTSKIEDIG